MSIRQRGMRLGLGGAAILVMISPVFAQEPSSEADADEPTAAGAATGDEEEAGAAGAGDEQLQELERRLDILAEEVERLRSGEREQELTQDEARAFGLAPSAATVYESDSGVSLAGYGEMLYENFAGANESGVATNRGTQFDFLRAILYAGYRFNDKFLFNSEIEVEHADEIFVEFAYIDYLAHENIGIRAGMLLVPMGLVNEFHEPTVFLGAERPVTEQAIIPSTWRENGGGVYGAFGSVSFRAYAVNGLNGERFSARGLRGGRQKGARAKASNMAFAGRVDVTPTPGIFFGASVYTGGSGQGDIVVDEVDFDVRTTIVDIHGQAQFRGIDLRGLYAEARLDDVVPLNGALGLTGANGVAEKMTGGYVQVGYDILSQVTGNAGVALTPYVRYERVDTQDQVAIGFDRTLSTDGTYAVVGVELKPISNIVVKVDQMWVRNEAATGLGQFNIGLGYAF